MHLYVWIWNVCKSLSRYNVCIHVHIFKEIKGLHNLLGFINTTLRQSSHLKDPLIFSTTVLTQLVLSDNEKLDLSHMIFSDKLNATLNRPFIQKKLRSHNSPRIGQIQTLHLPP